MDLDLGTALVLQGLAMPSRRAIGGLIGTRFCPVSTAVV
jgi:hypothetical protein